MSTTIEEPCSSSCPAPSPPPLARVATVDCSSPGAAEAIRDAFSTLGCFYATGLGVRRSTVSALLSRSHEFFALPLGDKMKIKSDSNFRGYTPMNDERLGGDPAGDFKEGVYFGRDLTDEADKLYGLPLHGPNQWPSEPAAYRPAVEAAFAEFRGAAGVLLRLTAGALGIPDDEYFVRKFEEEEEGGEGGEDGGEEGGGEGGDDDAAAAGRGIKSEGSRRRSLAMDFIRTLHYAPQASRPEAGELGCGAHSDYGFVTLLVTDGTPGLQILDETEKEWRLVPAAAPWPPANDPRTSRQAPPPPSASVLFFSEGGAGKEEERGKGPADNLDGETDDPEFPVFVNAGDMLHRWSNGLFRSAVHRVALAEEGRDRYSAAFFFDPPWGCRVEPLLLPAAATSKSNSSNNSGETPEARLLFPATTYGDYLVAKFKETHASFEAAAGEEVEKRRKKRVEEEGGEEN